MPSKPMKIVAALSLLAMSGCASLAPVAPSPLICPPPPPPPAWMMEPASPSVEKLDKLFPIYELRSSTTKLR